MSQFSTARRFRQSFLPGLVALAIVIPGRIGRSDDAELDDLDRNSDGRITMQEIIERDPRPPASDYRSALAWEERMMRQETAFRAADDDRDGAVSAGEIARHRQSLLAAILGREPPSKNAASKPAAAIEPAGEVNVILTGSWRVAGLVAGNTALLAVAAWMIRRRASSSGTGCQKGAS